MLRFFLQAVAIGVFTHIALARNWDMGLFSNSAPGDVVTGVVIAFVFFKVLRRFFGPKISRLCALALFCGLAWLCKYLEVAGWGIPVSFSTFEIGCIAAAVLVAVLFPDKALTAAMARLRGKGSSGHSSPKWKFHCNAFSVFLDFDQQTARLVTRNATWFEGSKSAGELTGPQRSHFDQTMPITDLYFDSSQQETKSQYVQGGGSWSSGGELGSLSLPGKYGPVPTGKSSVIFIRRTRKDGRDREGALRQSIDDALRFKLIIGGIENKDISRFAIAWAEVMKRVHPIHQAASEAFEARRAQDNLAREQAEIERGKAEQAKAEEEAAQVAANIEAARQYCLGLKTTARIDGDFEHAQQRRDGTLHWLIAVDRDGKGIVVVGDDVWSGHMHSAVARITADESSGKSTTLELELPDPDFEKQHLKKRRMKLARWKSADLMQEWYDRIGILSTQHVSSGASQQFG